MRFKCANRISIFLRSCRDCSKPLVPANDRATSRACSWMSRGILRDGSFGQHCGLSGQTLQSELACAIQKCLALVQGAACPEPLSARAVVDVAGRVISEVAAREGAVIPLRFIE